MKTLGIALTSSTSGGLAVGAIMEGDTLLAMICTFIAVLGFIMSIAMTVDKGWRP